MIAQDTIMGVVLEGTYRNGRVELKDAPANLPENSRVVVTLVPPPVDLDSVGIIPAAAADLRARLAGFSEDWDSPEMEDYDDYDAARAGRQAR
jgi:hypothetical protein